MSTDGGKAAGAARVTKVTRAANVTHAATATSAGRIPYETLFSTVCAGLLLNICLAAAVLPVLLALAFTGSPLDAWPFFVGLAALCAPAASAAFAAFEALSGGEHRVVRTFWSAYRTGFGRSLLVGVAASAAAIVLGADLQLAVGTSLAAATPLLAVLIALVIAVTPTVLVAAMRPTVWVLAATAGVASAATSAGRPRSGRLLWACAYLCIRKWYLSLANSAALAVLLAAVVAKPAVGLFLAPAPVLYVVWANVRHVIAPLIER